MTDDEYIQVLKDEGHRIRGECDDLRREVELFKVRNKVLQDKVKELMSK